MGSVTDLSEEERRALRGSKFLPLQSGDLERSSQARLAHPGGPLTTNKAAALAKFLERKLQDPESLQSLNPELVERAVTNAKASIRHEGCSAVNIKHVSSFSDSENEGNANKTETQAVKKLRPTKKIAKKKKNKQKKKKAKTS